MAAQRLMPSQVSPRGHPAQKRPSPSGLFNSLAAVFLFFHQCAQPQSDVWSPSSSSILNKTCVNSCVAVMCSCVDCALCKDAQILCEVHRLRSLFQWLGTYPTSLPLCCNNALAVSCFVLGASFLHSSAFIPLTKAGRSPFCLRKEESFSNSHIETQLGLQQP